MPPAFKLLSLDDLKGRRSPGSTGPSSEAVPGEFPSSCRHICPQSQPAVYKAASQGWLCRSLAACARCQLKCHMCSGTQVPASSECPPPEGCPGTRLKRCQMWPEPGISWVKPGLGAVSLSTCSSFCIHISLHHKDSHISLFCWNNICCFSLPSKQTGTVTDPARKQSFYLFLHFICINWSVWIPRNRRSHWSNISFLIFPAKIKDVKSLSASKGQHV